ncbi:TIGR04197 family type VII secretion effector [Enterococcus sp. AZ126]|uniref:TIGR04197 family type VII secretion effector n=1 Tax=Enterococcus sp. AZ126 TaxID=2774635 RepID=UPI003F239C10
MAINSNISVAGCVSALFRQSASALNSISASTVSSNTNVLGNAKAKQAMNKYEQGLKLLSSSVVSAGNNIHSVAKEFEKVDQNIAQLTNLNNLGGFR